MHVFNRSLIVLIAVLMIAAMGVGLLAVLGLSPAQSVVDRSAALLELERPQTVALLVPLLLLGVLLLFIELRPQSREPRRLTLQDDEVGRVTIDRRGLVDLVEHEAEMVHGISSARAHFDESDRGLRIDCRVSVDPTESLPESTRALRERLTLAIERYLGQTVAQLNLDANVTHPANGRRLRRHVR